MNYTTDQLNKLPKWAQSEIRQLQIYTKSLEERINEFSGESGTNTFLVDGLNKMPIQKNAIIEFQVGDKQLNKVTAYIRKDGNIDINTDSRMGHTMVILPRASNSFYISFIDTKE